MANLVSLRLAPEAVGRLASVETAPPPRAGEQQLRLAFLALMAVNVFLISGAVCFALLYFTE